MFEIELAGCTPEPLMNYLKALGVFRLVAEQAAPTAQLSWYGGVARLHTTMDRESLLKFFLTKYCPTPIVAPWNGGSGFHGGGSEPLDAIAASTSVRLDLYRTTITSIRRVNLSSLEKERILETCRNELPDQVVEWLDTCFVLGDERPSYFPLLGTGGNDGRLEFTNNFMQRVSDVVPFENGADASEHSSTCLKSSLFADTLVSLGRSAVGQFSPGSIGGPNGIQGKFEAESRVNPWDYVLMIEGSLLFAGAIVRKLGSGSSHKAAFPFSVDSIAVGYGSSTANEETSDGSRSELWLPIWDQPTKYAEVKRLFAEGRAQLGRRQARNSVEFALAVNLLGVNRGITAFTRFGFLKRNGLAFLAAPLGRLRVTSEPKARLLDDPVLLDWLDRLRRGCSDKDKTPGRYLSALRGIDRVAFDFANRSGHGDSAVALSRVLEAIGKAERTLSAGISFCKDKFIRPLWGLTKQWLVDADDGSREFRLAASLAGIRGTQKGEIPPLREYVEPVEVSNFVNWDPSSTSATWSPRGFCENLAAVARRRQMEAFRAGVDGIPIESAMYARLDDVAAFLREETNDERLNDLLWGILCVQHPREQNVPAHSDASVPFEYAVPRLLIQEGQINYTDGAYEWIAQPDVANAKPDPNVLHALSTGQRTAIRDCVDRAALRLKSGGLLIHGYRNSGRVGKSLDFESSIPPERLLAAMLFPLSNRDLSRIANFVLSPPHDQE